MNNPSRVRAPRRQLTIGNVRQYPVRSMTRCEEQPSLWYIAAMGLLLVLLVVGIGIVL